VPSNDEPRLWVARVASFAIQTSFEPEEIDPEMARWTLALDAALETCTG
jgi:hypothetical protein